MSTATLTNEQRRAVALFSAASSTLGAPLGEIEHEFIEGQNGNKVLVMKRVPVFRSGEFADSMGYEHLWEDMHMHQMVAHFNVLKETGTYANVPIRADHVSPFTSIIGNVIGYHDNLVAEKMTSPVDGVEYTYLLADMHIIKEQAQQDILSGLWRTRSAEIGPYRTNNKAEFWPVYQGVAYVDTPAVEGLEAHLKQYTKQDNKFSLLMMEEKMTGTTVDPSKLTPPAQVPAPKFEFSLPGQNANATTTDFAQVQTLLNEQFSQINTLEAENKAKDTELTTLRGFVKESKDGARKDFVKSLVEAGKVLATAQKDTEDFCLAMPDEQFAQYSKLMADVPVQPILGQYGQQPVMNGAPGASPQGADPKSERIDVLKDQVLMHTRMGKPAEVIKAYGSYKELLELDKAAAESLVK